MSNKIKNIALYFTGCYNKEYREFYHLDYNDEVFIVDTKDGLLITNHKYKVVEVENENSAQ